MRAATLIPAELIRWIEIPLQLVVTRGLIFNSFEDKMDLYDSAELRRVYLDPEELRGGSHTPEILMTDSSHGNFN